MKITVNENEMVEILKKSFPVALLPVGYTVSNIQTHGYPNREFTIEIEKENTDGSST